MEYLMTYGWAILIIAVVLGALFELGFFNSANLAPKVSPGGCQVYRPQGPGTTAFESLEGTCNNELPQYAALFSSGSGSAIVIPGGYSNTIIMPFTVTGWIDDTNPISLGNGQGIFGSWWGLTIDTSNTVRFWTAALGNNGGGGAINKGVWYFVATTISSPVNPEITVYVDGTQVSQFSYANTLNGCPEYYIGNGEGNDCAVGTTFNGFLSNFQVYNSSLSSNEILALYQEGIGGVPISLNNLEGWWPLNGNANDYSGNQNNGVPTGITYSTAWSSGYSAP